MPSRSAKPAPITCRASSGEVCVRWSQGTIGRNIVAAFDLFPPPIRSNPLIAKNASIAGFFATIWRSVSVVRAVRSSVAPSGSCAAAMM